MFTHPFLFVHSHHMTQLANLITCRPVLRRVWATCTSVLSWTRRMQAVYCVLSKLVLQLNTRIKCNFKRNRMMNLSIRIWIQVETEHQLTHHVLASVKTKGGWEASQWTHDVIMLLLRQNDVATSCWCCNDVFISSRAHWNMITCPDSMYLCESWCHWVGIVSLWRDNSHKVVLYIYMYIFSQMRLLDEYA